VILFLTCHSYCELRRAPCVKEQRRVARVIEEEGPSIFSPLRPTRVSFDNRVDLELETSKYFHWARFARRVVDRAIFAEGSFSREIDLSGRSGATFHAEDLPLRHPWLKDPGRFLQSLHKEADYTVSISRRTRN